MRLELLWFEGCPNHEAARTLIRDVLATSPIAAVVEFVEVGDSDEAARRRFTGSPTIRVNGTDIEPGFVEAGPYGLACRVYLTASGIRGVPQRQWLEAALAGGRR